MECGRQRLECKVTPRARFKTFMRTLCQAMKIRVAIGVQIGCFRRRGISDWWNPPLCLEDGIWWDWSLSSGFCRVDVICTLFVPGHLGIGGVKSQRKKVAGQRYRSPARSILLSWWTLDPILLCSKYFDELNRAQKRFNRLVLSSREVNRQEKCDMLNVTPSPPWSDNRGYSWSEEVRST